MRFNFTIQAGSPLISYTGGLWTEENKKNDPDDAEYSGGGAFESTKACNAKATLNFVGTGVSIFGSTRDTHGNFSVSLNNKTLDLVDGRTPEKHFKVDLWHSYGLIHDRHTVEVTNDPFESGSSFDVDFVTIERLVGQDSDEIFKNTIKNTDPEVRYFGTWEPKMHSRSNKGSRHSTTIPNSQVSISFYGCCIELYGLYTNAAYNVSLDGQPPVSMQGIDVDLPKDQWHPKTLLYLMDGLSEESHTVSLTATATSESRPFNFDKAIVLSAKTNGNRTSGLSQRALVGIALGVSCGVIMLLAMLVAAWFVRRRRRLRSSPRVNIIEPYEFALHPIARTSLGRRSIVAIPRTNNDIRSLGSSDDKWDRRPVSVMDETQTDKQRNSAQTGSESGDSGHTLVTQWGTVISAISSTIIKPRKKGDALREQLPLRPDTN